MHKKLIPCVAAAMTASVMMLGSCGIDWKIEEKHNDPEHIEHTLNYLNEKYGTEFVYEADNIRPSKGNVFGGQETYVDMFVRCTELPEKQITVYSYDGEEFCDDYICMKYEDRLQVDFEEITDSIFDGDKPMVQFDSTKDGIKNPTLPPDTTYEEFLQSGVMGEMDIFTDDLEDPVGDYRKLLELLILKRVQCQPTVYWFSDDNYKDISQSGSFSYEAKESALCAMRFVNPEYTLDDDFSGEYEIWDLKGTNVTVPRNPPEDETEDTYAEWFQKSVETESVDERFTTTIKYTIDTIDPDSIVEMPDLPDLDN
jgi:hypothetical protein